jgi:hypothetical protein
MAPLSREGRSCPVLIRHHSPHHCVPDAPLIRPVKLGRLRIGNRKKIILKKNQSKYKITPVFEYDNHLGR